MRILKRWKTFESNSKITAKEFCENYKRMIGDYKIVNGMIDVNGSVSLFGLRLDYIPKFRRVTGVFNIANNNLKTLENIPDDCTEYWVAGNPLHESFIKKHDIIVSHKSPSKFLNSFIQQCLEYDVWYNGKTNVAAIEEAWKQFKIIEKEYIISVDSINENYTLLDFNDIEILSELIGKEVNDESEIINEIIKKIKKSDDSTIFYKILVTLVNNSEDPGYYKELISDINSDIKLDLDINSKDLDKKVKLLVKKMNRDENTIERDEDFDCFAFIGREKFVKKDDDSYKKSLEIENLFKVDIYSKEDLSSVEMMKMRATIQGGGSRVYFIWIPKDVIKEDEDIPEWMIDLIDSKKTPI